MNQNQDPIQRWTDNHLKATRGSGSCLYNGQVAQVFLISLISQVGDSADRQEQEVTFKIKVVLEVTKTGNI